MSDTSEGETVDERGDSTMETVWDKGGALDAEIAAFTVGDDRAIDARLARHDVLGSLAHVEVLRDAELLDDESADALRDELRALYAEAESGALRPGPGDEDIHGALERRLTAALGAPGERVHTARSRNDQVAVDLALWMREQVMGAHGEALEAAAALLALGEAHAEAPLPGTTHMQPAMPSTVGLWAAGWAALLLDDARALRQVHGRLDACPLGSAAGYGVPADLAPIDRGLSAELLGFARPAEPATAVQGGRGKGEADALFAMAQATTTCARMARDVVLFVHPSFGFLRLPEAFTTGSSIMPQKKNPDVMELVRARHPVVQGALGEVMQLAASVPGGYHRDFQMLKPPLMRGVDAARAVLRMVAKVSASLEVDAAAARRACRPEIYATHRALELVAEGTPFRAAYRLVAAEVEAGDIDETTSSRAAAPVAPALAQCAGRLERERDRGDAIAAERERRYAHLLGRSHSPRGADEPR